MTTLQATQDTSAKLDYTLDWSAILAANGSPTITSATAVASGGAVASPVSFTTTAVTFRLATAAVTGVPTSVTVVVHVVLSTGEEDERTLTVQVTNR